MTETAQDRLARLLALVPWLRAHPGVDKSTVAAEFGITVRQLEDDLRLAFTTELPGRPELCLDIDYLDSDTVTVIDPQTIDQPLRLAPDEAVVLVAGLRALAATPGLTARDAVDRALAKLEDALGRSASEVAGALEGDRRADGHGSAEGGDQADRVVAGVVADALERGRRLRLRYWTPARDEVTDRDVDPMRLVTVDGVAYLEGWCHRSEAVRTFRLDRVEAVQVLDAPSAPPADAAEALTQPAGPGAGPYHPTPADTLAVLDLSPEARWVADYYPIEQVLADNGPDGALRVRLRVTDPRLVVRLMLRLGGAARVVEPVQLADQVVSAARTALAQA